MPLLHVLGSVSLLVALVVFVRYHRCDVRDRDPDRVVLATALTALGCTVLAIALQLDVRPDSDMKALLTAGIVAGGVVTAVFALWLNHRRYRIEQSRQEVEQGRVDLDRERHRLDQERFALERAKERREDAVVVVEGVARAVESFGDQEPRVRAAALHRLAGLAAHRPDRSQEVVDLVGLYLRHAEETDTVVDEAQRVLLGVVQRANRAQPAVLDLEVDLTGARLRGFTFGHVTVRALLLTGVRAAGTTALHRLHLAEGDFGELVAHRLDLDRAVFDGELRLSDSRLHRLSARGATLGGKLLMEGAEVAYDVVLADSSVAGDADFGRARFGSMNCNSTIFDGAVRLSWPGERSEVTFVRTRFRQANLQQFACRNRVVLDGAHVEEALQLPPRSWLPNVSLYRTTLGEAVVTAESFRVPAGWQVRNGARDDTRYLESA